MALAAPSFGFRFRNLVREGWADVGQPPNRSFGLPTARTMSVNVCLVAKTCRPYPRLVGAIRHSGLPPFALFDSMAYSLQLVSWFLRDVVGRSSLFTSRGYFRVSGIGTEKLWVIGSVGTGDQSREDCGR